MTDAASRSENGKGGKNGESESARLQNAPVASNPPRWTSDLVDELPPKERPIPVNGARLRIAASESIALATVEVSGALALSDEAFAFAIESGYAALARELRARSLFPLRIWNFVPGIGSEPDTPLSGYALFNAGRRAAFLRPEVASSGQWGSVAATAVDTHTEDLWIHVLAGDGQPDPIDNSRQIEPRHYSARYGPVPPAFARGVALPDQLTRRTGLPDALVSGTASIVGEETQHVGDLAAQLEETAVNLASMALARHGRLDPRPIGAPLDDSLRAALRAYRDLRIYVARPQDLSQVGAWVDALFDTARPAELLNADLCRPDLLVEAEGTLLWNR